MATTPAACASPANNHTRWRYLWLLALLSPAGALASPPPAILFHINPAYVTIGFAVRTMFGAFNTTGEFKHFSGTILLDLATPQNSHVDVSVASASIDTGWDIANQALRSSRYLDPARHPAIHFVSTQVSALSQNHVILHGDLTIRGITRPQDFDATLKDYRTDPTAGPVADFIVTGQFNRGDFGMTADSPLVAMPVAMKITAHIRLTPQPDK